MDSNKPDEAEAGEDVGLPDPVVADPDGTDARGTLLPLGTFANVVGEIEGLVNEGLLDGSFRTPPTGNGLEEPEALERLTGLVGADEPDGKDVDPETGGGEGEELDRDAGGELADRDPEGRDNVDPDDVMTTRTGGELDEVGDAKVGVEIGLVGIEELLDDTTVGIETEEKLDVELELSDAGPTSAAGQLEEEEGKVNNGPVGEELDVVEVVDDGPVNEELDVVEVDEEDELLVVTRDGAVVELELEEVVGVVPQPDIVEYDVTHSVSYHVVCASGS